MGDFEKTAKFAAKQHNLTIIRELLSASHGVGFNTVMKNNPEITPRMLSTRLKELEKLGLVQKNLVLGDKPKIEYRAQAKAQGLKKAITELEKWGKRNLE